MTTKRRELLDEIARKSMEIRQTANSTMRSALDAAVTEPGEDTAHGELDEDLDEMFERFAELKNLRVALINVKIKEKE